MIPKPKLEGPPKRARNVTQEQLRSLCLDPGERRLYARPFTHVFDHVAGYMTGNDVSERILQLAKNKGPSGSQWQFGKGFDTSGVCGPYMVTSDEISPQKAMNMDIK